MVKRVDTVGSHTILEGPHWDAERQSLYFNDILDGKIFRYDYHENKCYEAKVGKEKNFILITCLLIQSENISEGKENSKIGFIVPISQKQNEFIIGAGAELLIIQWDGISDKAVVVQSYAKVEENIRTTRFNDGKVDPCGRIFAGTMRSEEHGNIFTAREGGFYSFDRANVKILKEKINISNGLAWNEAKNKFYYIDTGDFDLKEFDYDPATGQIKNEKKILEISGNEYALDGMTIDSQGFLYIATFRGGKVIKFDPNAKRVMESITIPGALQITSVAFGGPDLDELFVTTGAIASQPGPNGSLFKVTGLGVKGTIMYAAKV